MGPTLVLLAAVSLTAGAAARQSPPAKPKPKTAASAATAAAPPIPARALETYRMTCAPCHGAEGKGVIPDSSLADRKWKHGSTVTAVAKTISEGVKGTVMLPYKERLTEAEILELARLVRGFSVPAGKKPPPK